MDEEISPGEGKQRALAAASRFALRKSNALIQERLSETGTGFNFEMIQFHPGEFVKILEQEETESPIQSAGASYGMRITGEIQYRITGDTDNRKLLSNPNLPLTVRIWSDKQSYKEGDKVVFYIQGNRDFFTRIIDIAPGGEILQLLPNSFRESDAFKGGVTYKFPDPDMGDEFDMETSPPFGKENVLIFAANVPIGKIPFKEYIGQFGLVEGTGPDVRQYVRQIALEKSGTFSCVDFFESRWLIITKEK